MPSFEILIMSGRVVDLALVALALEVGWLAWRRHRHAGGPALQGILVNAGAGASLLLALKAALGGAGWPWIAVALLVALGFHAADLRHRWTGRPRE